MANMRSAARVAALSAVFLLLAALLAPSLGAQDEERVAVVEIEQLRTSNGAALIPLRVTVESRRAVEAELEVRVPSRNMSWRFPLALAANTEVEQLVMIPTDLMNVGAIQATLTSDGEELAEVRTNDGAGNENAVGLLGIEAPGDEITLNPDIGRASLIELNDLRLLPALDSLVASPAGIRALAPEEQDILLSWVWSGKQLLVASDSGSIDEWIPTPAADGRGHELVGAGLVRYIGRDWAGNVAPGLTSASDPSFLLQAPRLSNIELFQDGGFTIPSLRIMTIILLVYVLVAGPLSFAILTSRKKQSLTWIVLPVLAALFTTGVFVGGKLINSGRTDAHAAIVEVNPVGGLRTETILISRSGQRNVELPENYAIVGTGSNSFRDFDFQQGGGVPITQRPSRTTTDVEFRIDAGSGGTAVVQGNDATVADQLVIEGLELVDGDLVGSVRNGSGETLEAARVLVGNRSVDVGSIGVGEVADFALTVDNRTGRFGEELRAWGVDQRNRFEFGPGAEPNDEIKEGPVNGTSWLEWRSSKFGAGSADGLVTAVGWSRELDALRDGTGRSALVARAPMPSTDAPLLPSQLRTFRMRVPISNQFGDFVDGPAGQTDVSQFVRPAGSDSSALSLRFPRDASELSVWIDDEWRWFQVEEDTGQLIAIPDEAWIDDTLTTRLSGAGFNQLDLLTLAITTDQTEMVALGAPGEKSERRNAFQEEDFFGGPGGGFEQLRESLPVDLVDDAAEEMSTEIITSGFIEGASYDVWEIALVTGDMVVVEMRGFDQNLDPFLAIRDPNDSQIAENDDAGGTTDSRVDFEAREDGVFQVEARPLGGGGFGDYELVITITRPGEAS